MEHFATRSADFVVNSRTTCPGSITVMREKPGGTNTSELPSTIVVSVLVATSIREPRSGSRTAYSSIWLSRVNPPPFAGNVTEVMKFCPR